MKRRNKFSLSHFRLLTGKMGFLYPIACVDTLPGDTFQMSTSVFLRFSPMVAPVMTPVTVKVHHWFVPLRLIWEDVEDFLTGGPDGTSVPSPPYIKLGGSASDDYIKGKLADYLGIPPSYSSSVSSLKYSTLYHRAYAKIWNEYYRDQNLQDEVLCPTYSGQESGSAGGNVNRDLLRDSWDKDYFTTATPWEQKGVAVNVPVNGTPSGAITISANGTPTFKTPYDSDPAAPLQRRYENVGTNSYDLRSEVYQGTNVNNSGDYGPIDLAWGNPALSASFSGSASLGNINLNQFREAMAMQRFEEHRALYGSRYVEYLRYLGIKASDARLQRPEYLGGGRSVIQFSEVLQTAEGTDPVGTMRGHGIGAMRTNRFRRFFEEHGIVMTLLSIRPKAFYTQGLPRHFSRWIKTDFWQKEFEHIGQQEVYNKEVLAWQGDPDGVFGYSDRYNEYRTHPSTVHGEFRDLLNYWHLGRDFESAPVLNSDFISSLPSDRIFADQTGNDTIYMMVNNSIQARRLVSKRGNPR